MFTIGNITKNRCPKYVDANLGISAVAGVDMKEFQAVRIDAAGLLQLMSAADQRCFGITRTGGKAGTEITVDVPFTHILKCKAAGTTAIGDTVQFTSYDAVNDYNVATVVAYSASVAKPVHGIALTAGAANAEIMVGVMTSCDVW